MCHNFWIIIYLFFMMDYSTCEQTEDKRRPFYIIGHMANSVRDVRSFVADGANAIEADVFFTPEGVPSYTYHGFPCDCWRFCFWSETIDNYLSFVRHFMTEGENAKYTHGLSLLYLDLKTSKFTARYLKVGGQMLAYAIIDYLIGDGLELREMPWIILGVPRESHATLFKEFKVTMIYNGYEDYLDKFGYDIYGTEKGANGLMLSFAKQNLTDHIWLGDGISNCFSHRNSNLDELLELRDKKRQLDGVYYWTVDRTIDFRRFLQTGLNGIVTNYPSTLFNILEEKEFSRIYRLATIDDRPWF